MGNHRWFKIECLHRVSDPESKRVKVAALNFLHPTASPLFLKPSFFIFRHRLIGERMKVRGDKEMGSFNAEFAVRNAEF
jgi:hypothetical protein